VDAHTLIQRKWFLVSVLTVLANKLLGDWHLQVRSKV
jgi:hypothetical protein